jgi:hypothetical protein
MTRENSKCLLCGSGAMKLTDYKGVSEDFIIDCEGNCPRYEVTWMSYETYFMNNLLSPEDKKKLIEYLKKENQGKEICLKANLIEEVTGVESKKVRF